MNNIFYFLVPFCINIMVTPLLIYFSSKTKKMVDIAQGDILKIHKKPISLLGGTGMALAFLFGLILLAQKNNAFSLISIVSGFLIIFLVMLWDDIAWKHISNIRPFLKFPILILSAIIPAVILSAVGITFNFIPFYFVELLLGSIFIFTVINSVNYQDGMDGLAGGEVFISLSGFALLGLMLGNALVLTLALTVMGAVAAFLVFNFPPAKIFMGDSGAYSLGFILTVLAILFSKPYNIYSVIGPIFIIGLPIFDGVFTNIRRLLAGKSIFLGDRSHFYDRLLQKGFSTEKTLAICYGLQIVLVIIGVVIYK